MTDAQRPESPTAPDVASDEQVEELRILIQGEIGRYDNDAYQATLLRAYVPSILNRLTAAESALAARDAKIAELERENEWRGLVLQAKASRHFYFDVAEDLRTIRVVHPGSGLEFTAKYDAENRIPARPSDDVVARIKEAVNV